MKQKTIIIIISTLIILLGTKVSFAQECNYVTDNVYNYPYPAQTMPGYLESYQDFYGQKIIRISGNEGEAVPTRGGQWGHVVKPRYQTESVWNADGSIMRLTNSVAPSILYLDGKTYEVLPYIAAGIGNITLWHPVLPKIRVGVSADKIYFTDITTGLHTLKRTFMGYTNCEIQAKGNISNDGSKIVVLCEDGPDTNGLLFFAYDMDKDVKYRDITISETGSISVSAPSHLTISPSGRFIVQGGSCFTVTASSCNQTKIFDLNGNQVSFWDAPLFECPGHFDLGFDENGKEIAAGVCKGDPYPGKIIKRYLETGEMEVRMDVGGYPSTSSMRNNKLNGWIFTTLGGPNDERMIWCCHRDEIDMAKLGGTKEIRRLGVTRFAPTPDFSNTRLVPSPDGTRVAFMSNWGNAENPIGTYVIETCDYGKQTYFTADLNQDSKIDSTDLDILKTDFLKLNASLANSRSDIDSDGQCTARDLGILMSGWKP